MFGLPALPRHRLNMGVGVHLLVDLENIQPSPQEVEAWLGEVGDRIIELASKEGDTVLDPFGGSGTTRGCRNEGAQVGRHGAWPR